MITNEGGCISAHSRQFPDPEWPTGHRCSPDADQRLAPKMTQLLLTAAPGSGKTTAIRRVAERLAGERLGGFYTGEMRDRGERRVEATRGLRAPDAHARQSRRHARENPGMGGRTAALRRFSHAVGFDDSPFERALLVIPFCKAVANCSGATRVYFGRFRR